MACPTLDVESSGVRGALVVIGSSAIYSIVVSFYNPPNFIPVKSDISFFQVVMSF